MVNDYPRFAKGGDEAESAITAGITRKSLAPRSVYTHEPERNPQPNVFDGGDLETEADHKQETTNQKIKIKSI
jgi:hypothetical protein